MEEDDVAPLGGVPIPHPGQQQILELPARVRVAVCGRRFGKTTAAAVAALRLCEQAHRPLRVWWIAPVQAQADAVEQEMAEWVRAQSGREQARSENTEGKSKKAKGKSERRRVGDQKVAPASQEPGAKSQEPEAKSQEPEAKSQEPEAKSQEPEAKSPEPLWIHRKSTHTLIFLGNKSRIEFRSAHVPDRLRGAGLDLVIIDEAADVKEYAWTRVVRPMLLDRRGEAFILGTPRGTQNWLHRAYLLGQSPEHAGRYASLRLPTSANPRISAEELESYRQEMTADEFAQECEAQFLDDASAVFTNVLGCVSGEPLARGRPGETYLTGVDLGDRRDCTVLVSVACRGERVEGFARFYRIGWWEQTQRILAHLRLFPGPCVVDVSGLGDPVCDQVRRGHDQAVVPFTFTAASKEQLVRGLAIGLESKTLAIPNVPQLIGELQAFQRLQDGRQDGAFHRRYGAPSGLHDDCVMALALAWWGLKKANLWGAVRGNPLQETGVFG